MFSHKNKNKKPLKDMMTKDFKYKNCKKSSKHGILKKIHISWSKKHLGRQC
jgi:hypothetical protein